MKIFLGNDHRGIALKQAAKKVLDQLGFSYEDLGAATTDASDYPDFAAKVGRIVAQNEDYRGLLFCGSGIGMSIAANKIHGIRAAAVTNKEEAVISRRHNKTNVLALGEISLTPEQSNEIIRAWLETPFDGGRHQRRVDKIARLERE